ncbi:Signal transduction histidine kinase [Marinospirillum alkaliphilum DSM 21637]|uniref:histidine kinase n=2 Tax=Marinospirillum TaxID=64968 RepID=A0A1K1X3Y7_9GAMM|nr:Signal transduction histidine kinase [Marinospirillum alkaliphilum DSM 21637]
MSVAYWRKTGMTQRLLLLLIISFTLVLLVAALMSSFYLQREQRAIYLDQQQAQVEQLVGRISKHYEQRMVLLENQAILLASSLDDLSRVEVLLQAFLSGQHFTDYLLLDAEGVALLDVPQVSGRRGTDYSYREFIREVMQTRQAVSSGPVFGTVSGLPSIFFIQPVKNPQGELVAMLVGRNGLEQEPLFESIRREFDVYGGRLVILDRQHQLFITATEPDLILQPLSRRQGSLLLEAVLRGETSGQVRAQDGRNWLYAHGDMSALQWSLIKMAPEAAVLGPFRVLQQHFLQMLLLMFVVIALLTGWIMQQMLRPVRRAINQLHAVLVMDKQDYEPLDAGLQDEIGQLLHAFDEVEALRRQQVKTKDELISVVSHELRTPLTSIHGALALMRPALAQQHYSQVAELLEIAQRNTGRLTHRVNDLLDMAALDSGQLSMAIKHQPLQPLIQRACSEVQCTAAMRQINLVQDVELEPPVLVSVDAERFLQVLTNLLSNAIKFSPEQTRVVISVASQSECVQVRVCDQGPGIPEHFRNQLFKRFSQLDPSDRRMHAGTGLGLAISRQLALAMHGDLGFYPNEHGGSCFYVELPVMQDNNSQKGSHKADARCA